MVTPNEDAAWALAQIFPAKEVQPDRTFEWNAKPRSAQTKSIKLPGYGSFQIMMGQTIRATPLSKLFVAMECATNILGGGMTQRLMHTVREQRGSTACTQSFKPCRQKRRQFFVCKELLA